ncbi:MAG: Uma2 family endonuclease [Pseudanabaena sp. Salubria-1]|jgi:Uma2 family endonuclease|nr:Uma2 family endonuclease [Pseudanabaena sp. Salubria-1]
MVITKAKPHSLEAFLELPETKPASEFINNKISQKPMPQGKHSLLQGALGEGINQVVKFSKIAYAFPELRCTFGGASIVPDIAVFRWERIPRDPDGQIANKFLTYPDWTIEILSPRQSPNKVLANILHCIENGTELGWMLDPEEQNIFVISSDRRIQMFTREQSVPVLSGVDLTLTVTQIFDWLNF